MKLRQILIVLFAVLLLTACKENKEVIEDEVVQSEQPTDTEETNQTEEQAKLPYQFPLTGEKTATEPLMRPVAVTINNHPDARPGSGIASADIVYELLVEGDATRLLAIFQSELPETIGPVRSARDYFIDLAKGYDAFYIAHGYSPSAYEMLRSGTVDYINGIQYDGTYFKRSSNRKAPHNSYISAENIERAAEKLNISLQNDKNFELAFYEDQDNVKMGDEANNIQMNYYGPNSSYSSIYTYDAESKKYLKSSPHQKTMDELVDQQVAISNVLFFETAHQVIDAEGRRVISLTDGGKAYVFQQGQMREVKWKNEKGLVYAVETDGSKVSLVPGKTWVHFVPSSPGLSVSVSYSE